MYEFFALQIGKSSGELVGVEHEGAGAEMLLVGLQVGSHLSEMGQLHDNRDGGIRADADHLDDVRMVELLHYV